MVSFRPLEAVQKLRDAGVDEPQATATVEVVGDATGDLVTRDYFDARFDARFDQLDARLDARFGALDAKFVAIDARFAEQGAEMRVFRSDMGARFEALRAEMYRANWLLGGGIVAMLSMIIGTLVAVVQVLD